MNNKLPCECEDSTLQCFYISILNNWTYEINKIVALNYIRQTEPHYFNILESDSLYYKIEGENQNWEKIILEIQIEGDTLFLHGENTTSKFVSSKTSNNEVEYLYIDNIGLLNKALKQRNYSSIEEIIKENNLGFSCNTWWSNGLNILYKDGGNKELKLWILEVQNGYLYIDKILNPLRSPFEPIKRKLIMKMKWDDLLSMKSSPCST
ncbi:hypothetical protein [Dysgonomonas termitidis]|uniref:Uncharacterized protein n=2 Tax=Dysgonomonas termitidis TaxID=1516126 RepID=A0ABV9L0A8_9BACT